MLRFIKDIIRQTRVTIINCLLYRFSQLQLENKVLIVAPHPDDEVLGCSGFIQRMIDNGKQVHVVILSGGGKSHQGCCHIDESTLIDSRRNLSRKAAKILNLPLDQLHFLDYSDGSISFNDTETQRLQILIEELSPNAIFVPHKGEGWSDHIEAGKIVREIIRIQSIPVQLYEYCVWFWYYNVWNIDWKNAFILKMNQKEHLVKLKAIDAYVKPLAPCGKPWSGVLPNLVVKANQWNCELYFKID
ncbi:PIG-L deacetylase family protein [Phocaeicola sp. HCN-6420]|uniref:PIG-L deacetylase family protein n=1 Tax=Phocaeicola sp. HCN-6420 TaxID=3134673 RepID=UPI0030BE870E